VSEPLGQLRRAIELLDSHCSLREIEVKELAPQEAEELACALVSAGGPEVAALVSAEGCGNPLFLAELARWANERLGTARGSSGLSLEQVILDRVRRLPSDARILLEILSVAGGPLTHAVAARASGQGSLMRTSALALRGARLVITRGLGDADSIDLAHDGVREAIVQSLGDERRRACHASIARALAEQSSPSDPPGHGQARGPNL
jgi:predicted ATPase